MKQIQKFWKENIFLNVVLFSKHINKCKKEGLKNYLSSIFLLKNIFLKIFILIILCGLILGLGFGLREHFIHVAETNNYWDNGRQIVILNRGIAFSGLENASSSVVYFVQVLPCIVAFVAILFINKWWIYLGFVMMFWGGMMNVIDRSMGGFIQFAQNGQPVGSPEDLKNAVVDYFPAPGSTFNIADVFVIMGVSLAGLSIVVWTVLMYLKERKNEHLKNQNPDFNATPDLIDELMNEYEELQEPEENKTANPTISLKDELEGNDDESNI